MNPHPHFSRIMIGVLCLAIIAFAGLVFVVKKTPTGFPQLTPTPATTMTNQSPASASLSVALAKPEASVGEKILVDVYLDGKDHNVTGAQIELAYDPETIAIDALVDGNFFTNPVVLKKDILVKEGKVIYIVNTTSPRPTSGVALRVSARVLKKPTNRQTVIMVLPSSIVTELANPKNILLDTKGAALVIQ